MGNTILTSIVQSGGGHQEVGLVRKIIAVFLTKTSLQQTFIELLL